MQKSGGGQTLDVCKEASVAESELVEAEGSGQLTQGSEADVRGLSLCSAQSEATGGQTRRQYVWISLFFLLIYIL